MTTPVDNTQITTLINDLEDKRQLLADAQDADNTAQATLQSATAAAQSTAAGVAAQKAALDASVDALIANVTALK